MQDLDEFTVTDEALEQMAATPNPRLKEISDAAVRHLHAFAREVNLTPEEWLHGIQFLTAVGQACTPLRQEFILLSDVLGLSAVVNALHDKKARELGSQSSLLGPFFREGAPEMPMGAQIVGEPDRRGDRRLRQGHRQRRRADPERADPDLADQRARAVRPAGAQRRKHGHARQFPHRCADGRYYFRTVRPLGYSIPMDGPVGEMVKAQNRHGFRPSHIHILIGAEGYRELVTALYFGDDAHIDSDTVFGVSGRWWWMRRTIRPRRSPGCARCTTISGWPRRPRARAAGSAPIRRS